MNNRYTHRALLAALLLATATLGGCYVAPYPYPYHYAYGYPRPHYWWR